MSKIKFNNAGPTFGSNPGTTAADISFSIHTSVEGSFYDVLYPGYEWANILDQEQITTDISSGATSWAYIARDMQGSAAFIGNGINNNIPMVGQSAGARQVPIGYSAVGANITNEDARQYTQGFNGNLSQDLGEAMRRGCDNLFETSLIFGNTELGFEPWINYTGITTVTVAAGVSTETEWVDKTPEEIVKDINDALTAVWQNSQMLFEPEYIYLPMAQFSLIGATAMVIGGAGNAGISQTILEFIKKNNIITNLTGKELKIIPSKYLYNAGVGSTARMIIMDRNKRNQAIATPLPYTMSAPVPVALGVDWYAEQKFSSYHVRQQGSMYYADGI